jgi:hypothetical protein
MGKSRTLTEEECTYVESFLIHAANIAGSTLQVPIRISHSVGDLVMHFYIDATVDEEINTK